MIRDFAGPAAPTFFCGFSAAAAVISPAGAAEGSLTRCLGFVEVVLRFVLVGTGFSLFCLSGVFPSGRKLSHNFATTPGERERGESYRDARRLATTKL
jgi:hypothetical protein